MKSGPASRHEALREELIARRAAHEAEVKRLDGEIREKKDSCKQHKQRIQELDQQLGALDDDSVTIRNYFDRFEWSDRLVEQLRRVFGIDNFRLAQEGVCNANMDGRNIICIMPTGGGKSLTYQLPATLMPGCTLVISPLISLMKDQILYLKEKNIEGLMFTASMSSAEMADAYNRLIATATGNDPMRKEVKLCYVTPERIAKCKRFMSVIDKMVAANKLARFVIDEAHCVSQQGYDYRPDYTQLTRLRKLYPHVPILALSATCPPSTLRDLMAILRLESPTDGRAAIPRRTVKFSSPLYRKNLHYKIVSKSAHSMQVMRDMVKYILECHPNETGIVYCLSRADSERVAAELDAESQGRIKTGVYHAEIDDKAKEELHESWHSGDVKVMCATIAFGLGIDKADVRFVLHHSMPKSIEAFYQESGRAGRDGKDADCVLYYRLVDAMRLPGSDKDIDCQRRVHTLIEFCLDVQGCRNLAFAKHFSVSEWAEDIMQCGHCDNCTRDPTSVMQSDVTLDAKRVLAVARTLSSRKIKVTAVQLAQAARGAGEKAKAIHLSPGDQVTLSLLDTETLIAYMLIEGFLGEAYISNAYGTQVYLTPGRLSQRLDEGQKLVVHFLLPKRAARSHQTTGAGRKRKVGRRPRISNGSVAAHSSEDEDADFGDYSGEDLDEDGEWKGNLRGAPAAKHRTLRSGPRRLSGPSASGTDPLREIEVIEISSESD